MNPAIKTSGLTLKFGNFVAVDNVSLTLPVGARHAIIGPNGAGKTSFVHALTGTLAATSGSVAVNGKDVTPLSQARRVRHGLARTFQINQLFSGLTVLENLLMALQERDGTSAVFWRSVASQTRAIDEAHELLALVQLGKHARDRVSSLPYGLRRLVEIAIALATRPSVLILDEPAAGVPSTQSELIFERIHALPQNMTLLFIEHDMNLVFRFADQISVLVAGRLLTQGSPAQISADERVREVYLGHRGHHAAA
ncbi:branched-chain amino acid transport system ATP-binding protein [Comamonas sp. BIGb0124]|uniref:ABC transporter ATP-binding protein n=1 Tax=Comamonas sp. BIGb0124 TaxID=2485130 RepID=UPI000F472CFE|nr:ABC transporter ATP-binding protein [Comamonas sp. BIGb0124]ROR23074.1 branched-chain amino acid transport system ATP-binding protein [Comamonas sp. BIGb0124]